MQYEGRLFWLAMVVRKAMRASRRSEEVGDEAVGREDAVQEDADALERDDGTVRI